ncbi:hypothetical protein like AT3G28600 [Hibiscus trionum]|uniref:Uncharacterized protein n=1 Tax=Hibiscus trionum TaxID=183268 RepID=A0A9W7LKT6_HIBTR|nr:hypothetical protein like AT3G28600 [Hibiscus trionum]
MMIDSWAQIGSTIAGLMFTLATLQQFFPHHLRVSLQQFVLASLQQFSFVQKFCDKLASLLKGSLIKNSKALVLTRDDRKVSDEFDGVNVWWILDPSSSTSSAEDKYFQLIFHRQHRDLITGPYLDHVLEQGKAIEARNKQRRLYTNNPSDNWSSYKKNLWSDIAFENPATFQTIAMDPKKKEEIINDLVSFSKGKEYYMKLGKPWKRGYLLYGPPGTDVTGERKKERSKTNEKEKNPVNENTSKVTLSGILNFIDGTWSACGTGRIFVFTTNHVNKLDPALIRRGRMDMHIELSYCSFEAFKMLAKNYLDLDSHDLFEKIGILLKETEMTPADVAENLMPKREKKDPDSCLKCLIQALEDAKEKAKSKAEKEKTTKIKKERGNKFYASLIKKRWMFQA